VKVLTLADGRHVARWRDALSGRQQQQSLDKLDLTTAEARDGWAITKAAALAETAAAIAAGGAVAVPAPIAATVDEYLEAITVAPATRTNYRATLSAFSDWCGAHAVGLVQELGPAHLARWRDAMRNSKVRVAVRGRGRGEFTSSPELRRAPRTVNLALVVVGAFLRWCRGRGLLPHLDSDAISTALVKQRQPRPLVEFLRRDQCKALLLAVAKHDAANFVETRREHRGEGEVGTTAKFAAVAPFTLLLLLTGCRYAEALELDWANVDLANECLRLDAAKTKTARGRIVSLTETPYAVSLLAAMRLRAGGNNATGRVFADLTHDGLRAALRRLPTFGAPRSFSWIDCRKTCGTFLANAASVYGQASCYLVARRLGHSVTISERHYLGLVRDVPKTAKTLEAALGIVDEARAIVAALRGATVEERREFLRRQEAEAAS
jgi:integrase